ncbi:uncharacterized protein [Temnothorax nylanderi]|uniref:uncharacterized protein n=1 Tax=Temnothorax nylanderi TaxID=102681 RepID=UPI003A8777BB
MTTTHTPPRTRSQAAASTATEAGATHPQDAGATEAETGAFEAVYLELQKLRQERRLEQQEQQLFRSKLEARLKERDAAVARPQEQLAVHQLSPSNNVSRGEISNEAPREIGAGEGACAGRAACGNSVEPLRVMGEGEGSCAGRAACGGSSETSRGLKLKPDTFDGTAPLREFLAQFHLIARANLWTEAASKTKTWYDERARSFLFQKGQKVWLFNSQRRRGRAPKLQSNWLPEKEGRRECQRRLRTRNDSDFYGGRVDLLLLRVSFLFSPSRKTPFFLRRPPSRGFRSVVFRGTTGKCQGGGLGSPLDKGSTVVTFPPPLPEKGRKKAASPQDRRGARAADRSEICLMRMQPGNPRVSLRGGQEKKRSIEALRSRKNSCKLPP